MLPLNCIQELLSLWSRFILGRLSRQLVPYVIEENALEKKCDLAGGQIVVNIIRNFIRTLLPSKLRSLCRSIANFSTQENSISSVQPHLDYDH
jgi:hypothetical protein